MIVSCVNTYKWTPEYCESLYLDDADFRGLVFWHKNAKDIERELIKPEK